MRAVILSALLCVGLISTTFAQGYDYITPDEAAIDVYAELEAHTLTDFGVLRQDVIDHIFPSGLPTSGVDFSVPWTPAAWVLSGTTQTAHYMDMSGGVRSYMSVYHAPTDGDCFFIYHFGHGEGLRYQKVSGSWVLGDPAQGERDLINGMLAKGCDVATLSMPLNGENKDSGPSGVSDHDDLSSYETPSFTPLVWFIEPVIRMINYAETLDDYGTIAMAGKSGGGWTTTVAASIDPRLDKSFSIAGSYPFYLRALRPTSDMGDWEQHGASMWDWIGYFDLYILSAMDTGRTADLIWRKNDSCCFSGARASAFMPQLAGIYGRMGGSGLTWWVDNGATVGHIVSPAIVSRITGQF